MACVAGMSALYYTGFFGLPWLWIVNVWLFWPAVRAGSDPEITKRAPQVLPTGPAPGPKPAASDPIDWSAF